MAPRHVLSRAASGVWIGAVAIAAIERGRAPSPTRESPMRPGPLVSVVIPARDEAVDIAAAVDSHLRQTYSRIQLIVVDDESSDGTGEIARIAAAGDPRFTLVRGTRPPDGWVGKSWACHQGTSVAQGDWILFTDADVIHAPHALAHCLAVATRLDRGGLTLTPHVETKGLTERVVMPAAVTLIQNVLAPGFLVRSRRSNVVMAAGAYLLVRRDVYDAAGGHAGINGRMVDDVALAAAIKRHGSLLAPANGTDLIRLRMYRGTSAVWRGWRKNAAFAASGDPTKGVLPGLGLLAIALGPVWATGRGIRTRDLGLLRIGATGVVAQALLQRLAAPVVTTPGRYVATLPAGLAFLAVATLRGSLDRISGRGALWRGRRYPVAR